MVEMEHLDSQSSHLEVAVTDERTLYTSQEHSACPFLVSSHT